MTGLAFGLLGVIVTIALVGAVIFLATGGRALIVRSGSMAGTIDTGDIAVTKTITAQEAQIGDVVTFKDPSRNGELVTHRVIKMQRDGDTLAFVTKGDVNGGVEKWTINARGKVGRFMFRVPSAGYALSWAGTPAIRFALLISGGLILTIAALRRIWAR